MKIGIDCRALRTKGGMNTYVYNLIKNLINIDEKNQYVLYYDLKKNNLIEFNDNNENVKVVHLRLINRVIWTQLLLLLKLKKDNINVFHGPKMECPYLFSKSVVTIPDISFELYPEYFTLIDKLYWKIFARIAAKRSLVVITISNATKNDLIKYYNIPESKIRVIYPAVDDIYGLLKDDLRIKEKYSLNVKFVLFVGTLQPRKNISLIIKSFYKLTQTYGLNYKLVLSGKKGWNYKSIFSLVETMGLENHVIFLDYIPEEDLPYLYNAADLFVYPSFHEGFGLPLLEAMACGTPVITSNTSSLPEVVGDAGIMIDPHDLDGLTQAMYDVLTNDDLRENMIKKGLERSKLFSWEKTARETLKVYESVVNGQ